MTYDERIEETEFTVTARSRVTERKTTTDREPEPERDPHPSFPPLRIVVVDGECVDETSRPLAKCRQVTPVHFKCVVG